MDLRRQCEFRQPGLCHKVSLTILGRQSKLSLSKNRIANNEFRKTNRNFLTKTCLRVDNAIHRAIKSLEKNIQSSCLSLIIAAYADHF